MSARHRRGRRAVAAALVALVAAACAPSGPAGPKPREVILVSEDKDRQVGELEAPRVAEAMGLVEDPELVNYVNRLGRRLVHYAPQRRFDYSFQIVDDDTPNVFALPGGFIFVSRGLLALSNSEDELANVLAHEIVHTAARHAAARQEVAKTAVNPLTLPGVLLGNVFGEEVGRALAEPFQVFSIGEIVSYSRDQEREADRLGQEIAAKAGFDPTGMATFLADLESTERLAYGSQRLPTFFDTHPMTPERVATAASRAQSMSWRRQTGIVQDPADYYALLDGLVVGTSAAEGVFEDDRFLHADLGFGMRFPDGWETVNSRSALAAFAPRMDGQILLELQGTGDDPERAGREFLEGEGRQMGIGTGHEEPLRIGSLPAFRAVGGVTTPEGGIRVDLTWIAYDGAIYRIMGATPAGPSQRYSGVFRAVANSFRPLTDEERASITETRLRVVPAHEGERLADLSRRTGNAWNVQHTAVFNDLFAHDTLLAGHLVKVAIPEPYLPEASAEPDSSGVPPEEALAPRLAGARRVRGASDTGNTRAR